MCTYDIHYTVYPRAVTIGHHTCIFNLFVGAPILHGLLRWPGRRFNPATGRLSTVAHKRYRSNSKSHARYQQNHAQDRESACSTILTLNPSIPLRPLSMEGKKQFPMSTSLPIEPSMGLQWSLPGLAAPQLASLKVPTKVSALFCFSLMSKLGPRALRVQGLCAARLCIQLRLTRSFRLLDSTLAYAQLF